jgi:hypothetical protein
MLAARSRAWAQARAGSPTRPMTVVAMRCMPPP